MSVTEYERNQLLGWFEVHMGEERAASMMSLLPPVGWADAATKRDLDVLAAKFGGRFDAVDAKFEALGARIDGVAEQMATKSRLEQMRSDLQRTFVTWMFAAQGAVVAAIGLLLAVLR